VILQSMYIFKPPNIGGEVVCHQDSTYIYTEPESCVGLWFALEDATLENGCMQFIPGGHKLPLKKRNYRKADGKLVTEVLDDTPWPEERKVPAEAEAGTLVVFDGRAPHLSAANRSSKSRHAYTLHVIDQKCRYPAENWLQRGDDLPLRGFDQG
jgi:phytanoyl-CoA hydroxylase